MSKREADYRNFEVTKVIIEQLAKPCEKRSGFTFKITDGCTEIN